MTTQTPDDHAILEAWRKMETTMSADIIPIPTHNRSVETISVQAYAGYVVMEADDRFETVNIHIPLAALDRLLERLHAARDEAAAMALPTRVKWLAGPGGQKAYAGRLQAAQTAFLALDAVPREQAAHFLSKLGTSAAPSGSDAFANCVRMLDERYGIREASGLFEADLRAIAGMK